MKSHWEVVNSKTITASNTPQQLWDNACKYFKWCDENPIESKRLLIAGAKAGTHALDVQVRPYSIRGLCLHCGIVEEYLRDIRQSKDESSEYYIVVSRILYIVFTQNLENATIGLFNPIFTSKVLNMEKDDTPPQGIKIEVVQGLPTLSKSENEILEKLELEKSYLEKSKDKFDKEQFS